jgi:flavorubredoxin
MVASEDPLKGACTMARIDQVADGIYRISVFEPEKRISFNQFVIDDERPTLIHTGQYPIYDEVRAAMSHVLDPSRLEYIIVPHFEADECGGMGRFVAAAKQASATAHPTRAGRLVPRKPAKRRGRT